MQLKIVKYAFFYLHNMQKLLFFFNFYITLESFIKKKNQKSISNYLLFIIIINIELLFITINYYNVKY